VEPSPPVRPARRRRRPSRWSVLITTLTVAASRWPRPVEPRDGASDRRRCPSRGARSVLRRLGAGQSPPRPAAGGQHTPGTAAPPRPPGPAAGHVAADGERMEMSGAVQARNAGARLWPRNANRA
jgi:hypothetical protein